MSALSRSFLLCIVLVIFDPNFSFPNPSSALSKKRYGTSAVNTAFKWESGITSAPPTVETEKSPLLVDDSAKLELQNKFKNLVLGNRVAKFQKSVEDKRNDGRKLDKSLNQKESPRVHVKNVEKSGENVLEVGNSTESIRSRKNASENDNLVLIFPSWIVSLGKCRANCLENVMANTTHQAANESGNTAASRHQPDDHIRANNESLLEIEAVFSECWSTCGLLLGRSAETVNESEPAYQNDDSSMEESEISSLLCTTLTTNPCLTGCQEACKFFHLNIEHTTDEYSSENSQTEALLSVERSAKEEFLLKWASLKSNYMIYSVIIFSEDTQQWNLIGNQTMENSMKLKFTDESEKLENIRVIGVDSQDLKRIIHINDTIIDLTGSTKELEKEEPTTAKSNWNLRVLSMTNQDFIVVAEVTWNLPRTDVSLQGNDQSEEFGFFLTWEVSGGAIKGNLLTESNLVTISLWPDTIYTVQVGLLSEDERKLFTPKEESIPTLPPDGEPKVTLRSEPMVLNTSFALDSINSASSFPNKLLTKSKSNKARKYSGSPEALNVLRISNDAREMKTTFSSSRLLKNEDYSSRRKLSMSPSPSHIQQPTARITQPEDDAVVLSVLPTKTLYRLAGSNSSSSIVSSNSSKNSTNSQIVAAYLDQDQVDSLNPFYWSDVNEALLVGTEYSSERSRSDTLVPIIFVVLTVMLLILACVGYRILSLSILANIRHFAPKTFRVMTVSGVLSRFSSNKSEEQLLGGDADNSSLFGDSEDLEGDETFSHEAVNSDLQNSSESLPIPKKY